MTETAKLKWPLKSGVREFAVANYSAEAGTTVPARGQYS
jgi:hypothetical protein